MSDSRWFDEWMRAWQSFPGAPAGSAASAKPWAAALDHFTRTRRPPYQQFAGAVDKLSEQSRAFFDLGEQIAAQGQQDWPASVFNYLDTLAEQFQDPQADWRQFAGHGADSGERHSWLSQVEKLLQVPGVGYTREYQEALQELSRRWLAYEKAYAEYAAYCAETARRSVEALRERLAAEFAEEQGPGSVRELYDAWVACSEEVYAQRAATEEYMRLHGRMVNALMAYRQQASLLMDRWAEALNLPTRAEVDALHRKLKDTRRELSALRSDLAAPPERTSADKRKKTKQTKKKRGKKKKKGKKKRSKKPKKS